MGRGKAWPLGFPVHIPLGHDVDLASKCGGMRVENGVVSDPQDVSIGMGKALCRSVHCGCIRQSKASLVFPDVLSRSVL